MRARRTAPLVPLLFGTVLLSLALVQFGCAPEYYGAKPENYPPTIESLTIENPPSHVDPTFARQGEMLEYVVTASDPEGDSINFSWSASCGSLVSGMAERAIWRATVPPGTSCTVTVVASDDKGASSSASDTIEVNAAPRRVSVVGVSEGASYKCGMSVPVGARVLDGDKPADPYECTWNAELGTIDPSTCDSSDNCAATYSAPSSTDAGDQDTITLRIIENQGMDERPGDKYTATVTLKLSE
jgi:hypothetical protein